MKSYHVETKCVQDGYQPKNGEPRVLPIVQSTTYKYDSGEQVGKLFDLEEEGFFYTRIANPTVDAVEQKIAHLEGGIGALCTSSGQAANFLAVFNLCQSGDHIISSSALYGGTTNLFTVTMKKMGIDVTLVSPDISEEDLQKEVRENTKCIFGETLSNPTMVVLDIEKFARVAHQNQIPLILDNTFATPIHCNPISFGADIVTHSTSKYMDGHAVSLGGAIVDSGNFNWKEGKFPGLTTPDDSYHGITYTEQFGSLAYLMKARVQMLRDLGMTLSPNNAFLLNLGLETLHLRMERHCSNAKKVAEYLQQNDSISWVNYPGLESSPYYPLARKYMPKGTCGVISFGIKGGRKKAMEFMDKLKLAAIVVHVADARTSVLHPASTTHRQLNPAQLKECGISSELIRMSVGIEAIDDILADISQALEEIKD